MFDYHSISLLSLALLTAPLDAKTAPSAEELYQQASALLEAGQLTEARVKQAVEMISKSAHMGHAMAQLCMAVFYDEGRIYQQNSEKAFYWFKKAADQGDPYGQYNAAMRYKNGDGVEQDITQALHWLEQAAAQQHTDALYELSDLYCFGLSGVSKDEVRGVGYLQRAAQGGHVEAQFKYSAALRLGKGTAVDQERSHQWLVRAAESGHASAQFMMGAKYKIGVDGLPVDLEKAAWWWEKSAAQGDKRAIARLRELRSSMSKQKDLSSEELMQRAMALLLRKSNMEDDKIALGYLNQALALGNRDAMYVLGTLYYYGDKVKQDTRRAFELFSQSAELGNPISMHMLSLCYENGIGVAVNRDLMILWGTRSAEAGFQDAKQRVASWKHAPIKQDNELIKKAEAGDLSAQIELAHAYRLGKGVSANQERCVYWLQQAAEQGDGDAAADLAFSYYKGLGAIQDHHKAFYWSQKASERGSAKGHTAMGRAYFLGLGVEKDYAKAVAYFQKGLESGLSEPAYYLALAYDKGLGVKQDQQHAEQSMIQLAQGGYRPAMRFLTERSISW